MTEPEAIAIRAIFESNPGWQDVKELEPNAVKALAMLPDTSGISDCNVFWQGIFNDAMVKVRAKNE